MKQPDSLSVFLPWRNQLVPLGLLMFVPEGGMDRGLINIPFGTNMTMQHFSQVVNHLRPYVCFDKTQGPWLAEGHISRLCFEF